MGLINFVNRKSRHIIQLISTILTNSYLVGFTRGRIYTGKSKLACVPVLNCYSCPGAVGSCPIGAIQAVSGDPKYKLSYYVLGFIMLIGVLFGRLMCGFACPFGFIQDLLYKIGIKKYNVNEKIDKYLRKLKYVFLVGVFLLPVVLVSKYGVGAPNFCKLICPAGTLEGGIPLLIMNKSLRNIIGGLFAWKFMILIMVLLLSIIIYRPFCKYICPLGAFYSLFNRFSYYSMGVDDNSCVDCKLCEKACKMNVKILENINTAECIRCGECKSACNHNAIKSGFKLNKEVRNSDI